MSDASDWRHLERLLARGLPDLLVIDWQPVRMSLEALRVLRQSHAALAIAVITDCGDAATVGPLVRAGALGVIPRDLEPRLVLRALEFVLLGGYYVPVGALGPDMVPGPAGRAGVTPGRPLSRSERADRAARLAGCRTGVRQAARAALLSPRQQQIMRLVHLGNTNKTIARVLDISEGTVKIHLAAVFRLLGAANRAAAVALYNGWQYGELQSPAADSPAPHTTDDDAPLLSAPVRLASAAASYETGTRSARRGERSPPYLIAAQPNWPFAPRRGCGAPESANTGDGLATPRSREFETREGATPRGCPRVTGDKQRSAATRGAKAGRASRSNDVVRTDRPDALTLASGSAVSREPAGEAPSKPPIKSAAEAPIEARLEASCQTPTPASTHGPREALTDAPGKAPRDA
ncbi:MAG TPA: response regulator transcription factor [Pararobbsia sp.]|nr:response regulator transcription factor [Pararobbsia sp.]